jgi:hypothetical protein
MNNSWEPGLEPEIDHMVTQGHVQGEGICCLYSDLVIHVAESRDFSGKDILSLLYEVTQYVSNGDRYRECE